ncbi:hypothetical protein [Micromonospora sp. NPDC001898]|uniref:hypothetical protein n=1 Tax=Micromonospora sp. NPDC001898 TaxID=3364221 RepID=UPI0036B75056
MRRLATSLAAMALAVPAVIGLSAGPAQADSCAHSAAATACWQSYGDIFTLTAGPHWIDWSTDYGRTGTCYGSTRCDENMAEGHVITYYVCSDMGTYISCSSPKNDII